MWYARPQLFFNCTLCPAGAKGNRRMHKEVSLVYFSTFEPCLYICHSCPVANVLGRAPLIPCFICGNSYPTIPHRFKDDQRLGDASAGTQQDRGNCSRLYEVNIWMLRYGRAAPAWCLSQRLRG